MSNVTAVVGSVLSFALLAAAAPEPTRAAELKCHNAEVMARGVGFLPSRKESEDAAKKVWLEKATKIFADATIETAKDPKLGCAKQGLYTNCTVSAIPCGTVPAAQKE